MLCAARDPRTPARPFVILHMRGWTGGWVDARGEALHQWLSVCLPVHVWSPARSRAHSLNLVISDFRCPRRQT